MYLNKIGFNLYKKSVFMFKLQTVSLLTIWGWTNGKSIHLYFCYHKYDMFIEREHHIGLSFLDFLLKRNY